MHFRLPTKDEFDALRFVIWNVFEVVLMLIAMGSVIVYSLRHIPRLGTHLSPPARGVSAEQYALPVLERDLAPDWLRKSWSSAKEAGLDQLSMDEIEAEIARARQARREAKPPSDG